MEKAKNKLNKLGVDYNDFDVYYDYANDEEILDLLFKARIFSDDIEYWIEFIFEEMNVDVALRTLDEGFFDVNDKSREGYTICSAILSHGYIPYSGDGKKIYNYDFDKISKVKFGCNKNFSLINFVMDPKALKHWTDEEISSGSKDGCHIPHANCDFHEKNNKLMRAFEKRGFELVKKN